MNKVALLHDYLHYYFSAKTRYGIHSPFTFDFVCNVVNKKTKFQEVSDIEAIRKELKKNNTGIFVSDLGAGSKKNSGRSRTIRDIAKHSLKSRKYASLLYRMVKYFKSAKVLELGTSLGISTSYMAKANPMTEIITVEGCMNIAEIAEKNAQKAGLKNIVFIIGGFDDMLDNLARKHKPDFVFFDGNHTEEATIKYFETCLPYVQNESVFVFDDINWSDGMKQAWKKIKSHERVTVTIDMFFMGLVFFRNELSKENFVVRF
ncbi:MAG: class I SAM-dependent methyltransferase [Bacteroidota bacterium]